MSDSSDDDLVLLGNVYLKMRKTGIHPINRERKRFGEYHHLFVKELKFDDQRFYAYARMTKKTFNYILDLVENRLMKNWCNWHKQPILPEERLVVTIRISRFGGHASGAEAGIDSTFRPVRSRRKTRLFEYEAADETSTDPEELFKINAFYPMIDTIENALVTRLSGQVLNPSHGAYERIERCS
ncbi:hypothetical protein evm_011909 [Chilo suppressalis]|nr:hypothetical protein evm_011909 [Chilo suppressalis]